MEINSFSLTIYSKNEKCILVIRGQKIYFYDFLLHKTVELRIWKGVFYFSDSDPYPANSTSKYSDLVLSGCSVSWLTLIQK